MGASRQRDGQGRELEVRVGRESLRNHEQSGGLHVVSKEGRSKT